MSASDFSSVSSTQVTLGQQTPPTRSLRITPVLELCLAALLIWGKFPYIPFGNTVGLLLLASVSLWLRGTGWRAIGLRRPASWPRTILLGVGIGVGAQALDLLAITPLLTRITGHPPDVSGFHSLIGNVPQLLFWLGITWSFAAFGEEMSYRGYLLNRVADFFGGRRAGWVIAANLSSALFGLGHSYQGIAGVIDITLTALIPVVAYLATGRNLWVPIILHGTGDTIGFLLIFFHRYPGL